MSEKKKVFISGPMSGIKDLNKPAFDKAEQWLTQAGYSVFNPARMHFDDAWTHEEIMRIDLAALAQCDYILMLPKWSHSKGAMQEYHYANSIGVEILTAHNAEPPKKEQNPSQRIEIETFGDISGRNIDFLMWFEKYVNEILASGGNLTDVRIKSDTVSICDKRCSRCKYHKFSVYEEPCKSCIPILYNNFEPKDSVEKACSTCKHNTSSDFDMLGCCLRCNSLNNWEPKDAEK